VVKDTAMLKADNIHKTYTIGRHSLDVLSGASLEIQEGDALAIIGKSGAGKSTLLHILGGLDEPDEGVVQLNGENLYELAPRHRTRRRATEIGFVFQSYHLLPEMDVLQNVMLPGMALPRGGTGQRLRERAQELLAAVGLREWSRHRPMELSGGEQQRVAMARALMNDPKLVLADEPTGNLDRGTGSLVLEQLFKLCRNAGHALILVTHDDRIASQCDRTLRLENGMLVGDSANG